MDMVPEDENVEIWRAAMMPADIEDLIDKAKQVMDVAPAPRIQSLDEASSSAAAADTPITPSLPMYQTQTEMPTLSSASEEAEETPQFIFHPAFPATDVVMGIRSTSPMRTLAMRTGA